jgi:hypothetical protein
MFGRPAYVDRYAAEREVENLAARASVARVFLTFVHVIVGIIVLGIVLVVLNANQSNDIVNAVTDASKWLVGPFRDVFSIDDPHWRVVVNWGLAAVIYSALGNAIARLIVR